MNTRKDAPAVSPRGDIYCSPHSPWSWRCSWNGDETPPATRTGRCFRLFRTTIRSRGVDYDCTAAHAVQKVTEPRAAASIMTQSSLYCWLTQDQTPRQTHITEDDALSLLQDNRVDSTQTHTQLHLHIRRWSIIQNGDWTEFHVLMFICRRSSFSFYL